MQATLHDKKTSHTHIQCSIEQRRIKLQMEKKNFLPLFEIAPN